MTEIRFEDRETEKLLEPQAKKTVREIVRDTFTPSRVGLLSWAFAAVLMGTIGLASYQFGASALETRRMATTAEDLTLPPPGDIKTTSSIGGLGQRQPVAIMQMPASRSDLDSTTLSQSQIEVLQREIVGLRRRLSALTEQNLTYSSRIAALEKQVALAKLSDAGKPNMVGLESAKSGPGVMIGRAKPETPTDPASPSLPPAKPVPTTANVSDGQLSATPQAQSPQALEPKHDPRQRLTSISHDQPGMRSASAPKIVVQQPVRIVKLPETATEPQATGSIPTETPDTIPQVADNDPSSFVPTPTQSNLKPKMISPSAGAGRLRGSGDSQLKRSDFGAVIGHFSSSAAAAKAWGNFKEQNEERMRDLRPLLTKRNAPEGGIALLVGPFGNAADAAVACVHLLDVTNLCHPALFAGDPLVTAARFRESAF